MSKENHDLIECGDHQFAPWSIVCKHLADGECPDWLAIDSTNPEVDYDWVCPTCIETFPDPKVEDLRAVCIHCVRKLRKAYDPLYEDADYEV